MMQSMQYLSIGMFLATHRGHFCEACLAQQFQFSIDDIRARVGQGEWGDITITYGICQTCLSEHEVVGRRSHA